MSCAYTVECAYNENNVLNEISQICDEPPCSVSLVGDRITVLSQ